MRSRAVLRIGAQIRALRVASGASGGQLAHSSAISPSLLSRIEHGLVLPSVETLDRIASGLDMSMSRFLVDRFDRTDFCHVPAGKGIRVDRMGAVAGYGYELLGHLLSGKLFVEPCLVRLAEEAEPCTRFQHPGLKFLHMVSGRVTYRHGAKVAEIGPGDSLLFEASVLHGIDAISEAPVTCLCVVFSLCD
ncbi:transcriptional regulator, XRE family with cupin sensor [Variovorax sp. YR752]|uniref:helix-turn-helix domain-containing protein n=1 Tax=unclassified Variovorax TaxID=663243 RepID=UPI000BD8A760|nr:XRE family transcriptional regulator [Variovorax sp. YR752]SOE06360.1 transcriptional regulator, XRE family with cupin sensor [Variovorax sp. YR752]